MIDDFNRRDLDAYLALIDPEVEFTPYEVSVEGGDPYRGHDGVLNWWKDSFAVLSDPGPRVYEVRDLGAYQGLRPRVPSRARRRERAALSGRRTSAAEWRTRKIVRWGAHASEAEALEAAGLSE